VGWVEGFATYAEAGGCDAHLPNSNPVTNSEHITDERT
jgi:hypothetical protein